MNTPIDPLALTAERFAIGQPVSRKEDAVLLRDEGRYTDDLNLPGERFAVMVRSRIAHGTIVSTDVAEAGQMQGVRAVFLAKDSDAAGIWNMPAPAGKHRGGTPTPQPSQAAYQ